MKKIKVAINGFGRIGRAFLKIAWEREDIEIVAVNDLGSIESLSYLLRHDTVYRNWGHPVRIEANSNGTSNLLIDDKKVLFISEKDTTKLPWKDLDIDVVVESTGLFTSFDKAKFHLDCGAKKVVISAPSKGAESTTKGETIILGVNEDKFGTCDITSNASCTSNAASPLIAIMDESIGIEKAVLNTVHGYTAAQVLVDGPSKKDLREGRAAAQNIVPSSTGAAIALTEAFPSLKGLFDGLAIRVPVVDGSIVDVTFIAKRNTTKEEVNEIMKKAAKDPRWEKLFTVTEDNLVSSDILGESHACIADIDLTRVVGGNLVKVLGWYDNEMGYTYTLVDHVVKTGNTIK
ncbi:MAG: Glyceraldehyde-3-phosphate dehydrogenase, type I [Candidatus Nomurabacteria bacterium GW2011_GWF2_35_66]|uniref:Glyceraldehyde-3-phosphate dehydrogenase, type I n=1 Tax=Candidatus Nomurabacteria bacterium GW2011_GWE1_35_16 TaxID=1618761 RepID=A0A0G0BSG4_9BACT|nr:MAG: Glyceraldehyde-3-phosphate dehydrogenase, type I [Candidatus Nomurabacteria bacterium GW2011_GWF1_34_20]KKP63384.1 MAG: Glyceraldehyde-3-phosphate dehydrogenase, type I [Candidatus Nomurabacteria bacterium GW2011_GWE2_34_25]KKP66576.1 MAG: Glyceraldehyde-3-phosphate dehydrogenase, type I [Candidatus Nomurabacteria bacterium GW2011_GWE1_35_16]KKP83622.1 MAG: Glyceraldehyde-3-phosphate dehydrogenase, type I [Candidatus Nomurabacteria bacterium GW2011_GWF2_35_66]HAE36882.1 type I glycerald